MDAFSLLGLEADADEAAIKRAYAQRLRSTRPDDDPAGFQRLNEAYRAALARAKATPRRTVSAWSHTTPMPVHFQPGEQRPVVVPAPSSDTAAQPVASSDTSTPPQPAQPIRVIPVESAPMAPRPVTSAFNPDEFVSEFRQRCVDGNAQALAQWLSTHPAFWHLPTKYAAGRYLLRALFEKSEPMSAACFDAVAAFFNFGDALNGIDPLLLHRVRQRGTMTALVRDNAFRELARRIYGSDTVQGTSKVRSAIRLTRHPFTRWRALRNSLIPDRHLQHTAKVLLGLCGGYLDDLPAPLDKQHARFWIDAGTAGFAKAKLWVYLARSVMTVTIIPLAAALLVAAISSVNTPHYVLPAIKAAGFVLAAMSAIVALFWGLVGMTLVSNKLDLMAGKSRQWRIATFSLTPALCSASLLVAATVDVVVGTGVAVGVMFLALFRNTAKHGRRKSHTFGLLRAFAMIVLSGSTISGIGGVADGPGNARLGWQLLPIAIVVAVTLGIWAWDWHKRGFLARRAPGS